jgi:N-acetyltransferase
VRKVWLLPRWRGRGLALRLLDCARAHFMYARPIAKHEVAFSQPTDAGRALATRYADSDGAHAHVLIYRI